MSTLKYGETAGNLHLEDTCRSYKKNKGKQARIQGGGNLPQADDRPHPDLP